MDGMDHFSVTQAGLKYISAAITGASMVAGRFPGSKAFAGNGVTASSLFLPLLGNHATLGQSLSLYAPSAPVSWPSTGNNIVFTETGSPQITVAFNLSGQFTVKRGNAGGTLLGTSTNQILGATWYWVEVKVTFATGVGGRVEIRVNDSVWLTLSGINTSATGNAYANAGFLSSNGADNPLTFDDYVVWNTAGAVNNDFLGDSRIVTGFPDSAGDLTQWTPSAGANWQNVDENPPDDDATYNSSNVAGDIDTYGITDFTLLGGIKCVQNTMYVRKTDAAARQVASVARRLGMNTVGTPQTAYSSYRFLMQLLEQDPYLAAQWQLAELNATQFGVENVI
jgi:hypothetical protein